VPASRLSLTPACASSANLPKRAQELVANIWTKLPGPIAIILGVVAFDQLAKAWAVHYLADKPSVEVLGRSFMLTLVYNEGGALGTSIGSSTYYLISSILILIFVLYYLFVNRDSTRIAYPLAFTAGGAVGNIIDRIRLGRVIDFLDVDFFDINLFGHHLDRWWTFNVADTAISCSILFLLISVFLRRRRHATDQQEPITDQGPL
jgi:signal peptidase II